MDPTNRGDWSELEVAATKSGPVVEVTPFPIRTVETPFVLDIRNTRPSRLVTKRMSSFGSATNETGPSAKPLTSGTGPIKTAPPLVSTLANPKRPLALARMIHQSAADVFLV